MLRPTLLLCALASLALGTPGHAQTGVPAATSPTTTVAPTPPTSQAPPDLREHRAIITIQIENDVFTRWARSDKDYTNGVRLGWLSAPIVMPSWLTTFTTLPTFFGEPPATGAVRRWGFSIGQNIYTPENTSTREPIFDDRPYAGWAYIGFALQYTYTRNNEPVRLDTVQLDFGVVGPAAQGRFVQNKFHSLIGVDKAHGWSNQLDNQFTVNLTFERRWRTGSFKLIDDPALEVDFIPSLGFGVGNAQTYAGVGGIMRIGNDLRDDFGPPRARPSLPGSETFTTRDDFGWYLFVGAGGQAFAYNNFLDRKAFAGGPDIDSRIFVGELSAGLALLFRGVRLSYTHVVRSPEFSERKRLHQYGSLSLAIRY